MRRRAAVLLGFALAWPVSAGAPGALPSGAHPTPPSGSDVAFRLTATIPLPDVDGRIDHMTLDARRRRLFVAALGHRAIEVVDLAAARRVREIGGWTEPQGVCYAPESDRLFVSDGSGRCAMLDGETLDVLREVRFGDDADNVRYDAKARRLYVGYGDGGLGVIDAATGDSLGTIALSAHPEAFELSRRDARAFVNVPGAREVEVAERDRHEVVARWPLHDVAANFPMALDEAGQRLFVGCRKPARLLVLDSRTGVLLQSLPLGGDSDDLFFDAARGLLLASGGEGVLEAYRTAGDRLTRVGRARTRDGARTSLWVPEESKVYVAAPRRGGEPAAILVYEVP
ncbi:MAG: YncE family protein [bacterium]